MIKFNFAYSKSLLCLALSVILFSQLSCSNDVEGCTIVEATNFNPDANVDDKSCSFHRDEYVGIYSTERSCSNGMSTPSLKIVAIAADFTSVFLEIEDFSVLNATTNEQELSIPLQDLVWDGNDGYQIEGTAKFEANVLKFNYEITSMALSENLCTMEATRQ